MESVSFGNLLHDRRKVEDDEVLISPTFLADSLPADIPEGVIVEKARRWWNEAGSNINWHPSYGICDP